MAKARFSKGLRVGSTKSETYSTLATQKYGRVQIIKDRVTEVANPQTVAQMRQRVIFATVTQAAKIMAPLIEISQEGVTDRNFSRQRFIAQNIQFLQQVVGRRVGLNLHYLAAYAPKGNTQLIPNGYIVSDGSLQVPTVLLPRTSEDKGAFGASAYNTVGSLTGLPFGSYTPAQLWRILFGLLPGDQVSFPQIYADGAAQTLEDSDGNVLDKTLYSSFACPRVVLLSEMPDTTLAIGSTTTAAEIIAALRSGVDEDNSLETVLDNWLGNITVDDTADDTMVLTIDVTFDQVFGVNNDDTMRALGCILSRKNDSGAWQYSKTQLICVWDFLGVDADAYFGFTIDNAIATYLGTVKKTAEGNFLQTGGSADVIPSSFQ